MSQAVIEMLIRLHLLVVAPESIAEAESRYGLLDADYQMLDEKKHIVQFSFKSWDLPYSAPMNRDMAVPLALVLSELQVKNLLKEITEFNGCYVSRPVRGLSRPSTHAYGLSCDFNNGPFSFEFVSVWKKYGFCWGGDFERVHDPMHFSYAKWEC